MAGDVGVVRKHPSTVLEQVDQSSKATGPVAAAMIAAAAKAQKGASK